MPPDAGHAARLSALLAAPEREPVLDHLVCLAAGVLRASAVVLSTSRDHRECYKAWHGIPEPLARRGTVPLAESLTRPVLAEGRTIALDDVTPTGNTLALAFDWMAWLGAPLLVDGTAIGALWAVDSKSREWQTWHIDIIEQLAAAAVHTLTACAERHKVDALLRDRNARYDALAATVPHGVWGADLLEPVPTRLPLDEQVQRIIEHARLSECNPAFARAFGAAYQEDLLGARLSLLFDTEEGRARAALTEFVRNGYQTARLRVVRQAGASVPREWTGSLAGVVEDDHLVRVWGIARVDGARQDAAAATPPEEQARASHGADALGRVAAGVAHEFNNLLTTIRGRTELALRDREDEPSAADLLEIRKATDRAVVLNRQLIAFGRKRPENPGPLRPACVIAGLETVLQHLAGDGIEFAARRANDTGRIVADLGGFERALLHLISWLRDASPAGGRVLVTSRNVDRSELPADSHRSIPVGRCVVVSVTHSLLRLDQDTIARITEPDFSPLGLGGTEGLVSAMSFVRRSGGDVLITSDEDGIVLSLVYPAAGEEPAARTEPAGDAPVAAGETVLIVEDEEGVRAVARRTLLLQGYTVMEAEDAQVALDLASAYAGQIHVLLSDVVMPGLTGPQLASRLRAMRPETRVILMSGYAGDMLPDEELRRGTIFLEKPFTPMTLARIVRQTLDRTD
ncbi:MAG: response regulator [Gemmatimonadetes bacterium]|nr:response regulator [Gemmatimonadota bacterium]